MIHYYDPVDDNWKSIDGASTGDIAEMLIAVSHNRPCEWCDADVEYEWTDGPPNIVVTHDDGCPGAA